MVPNVSHSLFTRFIILKRTFNYILSAAPQSRTPLWASLAIFSFPFSIQKRLFIVSNFSWFFLFKFFFRSHRILFFNKCLGHFQKCFINSLSNFSTCFKHFQVMGLFKSSNILISYFNFSLLVILFFFSIILFIILLTNITLIRKYYYIHITAAMFFYFFQPSIHIIETIFIRQVEHNKNPICTFVICLSNCTVSFLSRSVPYLQPYCALINL